MHAPSVIFDSQVLYDSIKPIQLEPPFQLIKKKGGALRIYRSLEEDVDSQEEMLIPI